MASLFISYSRKDIAFARKLTSFFEGQGLDFWIDWEGIPPTVDWWREIERGIEQADIFLFLLSPDSATSKVCKQEIEYAVKNGKRLIPVVIRDIKGDDAPAEFKPLNWIFLRESDDFDNGFKKIITAIKTDYDWVQIHRQLQVKALEWERINRENSFLLRGRELMDAEAQLATNSSKEPYPTDLQREYVFKSRQVADRQRRNTTSLAVAGLIILAFLTVIALFQADRATKQADIAQTAQAQAEERAIIARAGELTALSVSEQNLHFDLSLLFGIKAWQTWKNSRTEFNLMNLMTRNPNLKTYLHGHQDVVSSIAYNPKGNIIASGSYDNTIILWDSSNPDHAARLCVLKGHTDHINSIAFSPDGKILASGSDDHTIILWDVDTPKSPQKLSTLHEEWPVLAIAFHPSGRVLASGLFGGSVNLWDVSEPTRPSIISSPGIISGNAESVAFSPDGRKLAVGQGSGAIGIWEISSPDTPKELFSFSAYDVAIYSIAFSKDGNFLASGSERQVVIWDVSDPALINRDEMGRPLNRTFLRYDATARHVAFSPDGNILAVGGDDRSIRLWDNTGYFPLATLEGHSDDVYTFAFDPRGNTLVSGGADKNIILWDINPRATPFELSTLQVSENIPVDVVALSSDGKLLASSAQNSITLWEIDKNPPVRRSLFNDSKIRNLIFSPDDRILASEVADSVFKYWNVRNGNPIINIPNEYKEWIANLAYGPDGKTLMMDNSPNHIKYSDWYKNKPIEENFSPYDPAALSPDKKVIAAGIGEIVLWNVENNKEIKVLPGIGISALEFNPSGSVLISGEGTNLEFWDINTYQPIGIPQFQFGEVYEYGPGIDTPRIPDINDLSFSQDGTVLAMGLGDGKVTLLNFAPQLWMDKSCQRAGRNLTQAEWSQYFLPEKYELICSEWLPGE